MPKIDPKISKSIVGILEFSEPLETKEIIGALAELNCAASRSVVFYRLQDLRAQGAIKGKFVGPGKGVWIWWKDGNR